MSKVLVVLGTHRSGTSAVTELLTEAGFSPGEDQYLIQADPWNPRGYFELWPVVMLNEIILYEPFFLIL